MDKQRASTPEETNPHQQAYQETLVALNQDPRVLVAMQEHLLEQVSLLRVQNKMLRAELAALKDSRPPKARKKAPPRTGRGTTSTVPDQKN